jgi:hypothetical protein
MFANDGSTRCVVRCDSSRTARVILCLLAFVVTGIVAYQMGSRRTVPAARCAATATIHHALAPAHGQGENSSDDPPPSTADVGCRIASEENLGRERADGSALIGPAPVSPGLVLIALVAGLAVAGGVGLIQAGFDTDRPLESVEEAEAALGVPIVGVIPTPDAGSEPLIDGSVPRSNGLMQIIAGTSVVAVSLGLLVLVF